MAITIRIRIAEYEIEATGPRAWVERMIAKCVRRIRRMQRQTERGKDAK